MDSTRMYGRRELRAVKNQKSCIRIRIDIGNELCPPESTDSDFIEGASPTWLEHEQSLANFRRTLPHIHSRRLVMLQFLFRLWMGARRTCE